MPTNSTNQMKARIYQTHEDSKCRMCRKVDESINHIVSECPKLAQKEYKRRHYWVVRRSIGKFVKRKVSLSMKSGMNMYLSQY